VRMSRPPNVGMGELSTIARRNNPNPPKCRTSAAIPCGCRGAGLTMSASVSRSRTVAQGYDTTFSATGAAGSRQSTVSRRQSAGARRKRAIHHSPFTSALITCPCFSICRLLTPESRPLNPDMAADAQTQSLFPTYHLQPTTYLLLTTFLSNNIPAFKV